MEDHAHAMGHQAMGQMQMDGQSLHNQVLTGYPAMGSEVGLVPTTGAVFFKAVLQFESCRQCFESKSRPASCRLTACISEIVASNTFLILKTRHCELPSSFS